MTSSTTLTARHSYKMRIAHHPLQQGKRQAWRRPARAPIAAMTTGFQGIASLHERDAHNASPLTRRQRIWSTVSHRLSISERTAKNKLGSLLPQAAQYPRTRALTNLPFAAAPPGDASPQRLAIDEEAFLPKLHGAAWLLSDGNADAVATVSEVVIERLPTLRRGAHVVVRELAPPRDSAITDSRPRKA